MTTPDERFENLYRRYYARLCRLFRRTGFGDDDSHDLAQDAFRRVYENLDRYRGDAEWGFLETTALNLARNAIRSSNTQKRSTTVDSLESLDELPDVRVNPFTGEEPPSPELSLIDEEATALLRERLSLALANLPAGARQCLILWMQGFKYDEIAILLQISTDAVRSRLRDAKRAIREDLGPSAL